MKNKKIILLFISIVIIATFFRLYNLKSTPPGLYPDEAMNGNNALETIKNSDWKVFYPENNGREGLFINIQALSIMTFGNEPWALRVVSAIFGILTVVGIYLFVKKILTKSPNTETLNPKQYQNPNVQNSKWFSISRGEIIALLSSFFVAVSFWHINFSRIGFRAIMAPAFIVWSLYILMASLQKVSKKSFVILSIVAGIVYGLGMYSYISYRATPILILLAFFLAWKLLKIDKKKVITGFIIFTISAIVVFLPLGIYFIKNPADFMGRTSQLSVFSSDSPIKNLANNTLKTIAMFNFNGDFNWRHNLSGRSELNWLIGIFFIIGIITGAISIFKKKLLDFGKEEAFLVYLCFAWFILALAPTVISNEGIPHALRSILAVPPVFIFSAIGVYSVFLYLKNYISQRNIVVASVLIGVILIFDAYISYFVLWAKNPNTRDAFNSRYSDMGREINSMPSNIKKYIVVNADGIDIRGIPMPAQTIMFITNSFLEKGRIAKNINYISPKDVGLIDEENSIVFYLEPENN